MGSLRNPVGPLPSSIYWRRRAVLLSMVALLALLITWIVTSGDGGGTNDANGSNGKNPAPSITPGPTSSGPAISEAPGGRDESGEESGGSGGSEGSGGSDGSGDSGGDSAGSGGADGSSGGAGGGSGGGSAGVGGGGVSGDAVPAGSSLPNCTPGAVKLTLRSVKNSYSPDEQPKVELIVTNSSATDCKLDLGPKEAVLTITQAGGDDEMWSSADCPTGAGSVLYRIPAQDTVTRNLEWDRKASAPKCATPPAGSANAGTYLVEATAPGLATARTSFVLAKD